MIILRSDGRAYDRIRYLKVKYDPFGYADSSVLFEIGDTKVLVSVNIQKGVPHFLKGKGTGWLNAEYSMLPSSTRNRTMREANLQKRNSRSVEISRLISRSLRSVVDLKSIGERTIIIDCDVLQADGGTRVASVSAASLALTVAQDRWLDSGIIDKSFLREPIVGISIGIVDDRIMLDLSQEEDNNAKADFNFILTKSGNVIEIQGTSEKSPISWENFDQLKKVALSGVQQIFEAIETPKFVSKKPKALFSLGNRGA